MHTHKESWQQDALMRQVDMWFHDAKITWIEHGELISFIGESCKASCDF